MKALTPMKSTAPLPRVGVLRATELEPTPTPSDSSRPTSVGLPIRTVSEANTHDGHWRRARRARSQRGAARIVCGPAFARLRTSLRRGMVRFVFVRLTRISPKSLDDDNLRSALKAIRDGVTDALGLSDDRDDRLVWSYSQRQQSKTFAVEITAWSEVNP